MFEPNKFGGVGKKRTLLLRLLLTPFFQLLVNLPQCGHRSSLSTRRSSDRTRAETGLRVSRLKVTFISFVCFGGQIELSHVYLDGDNTVLTRRKVTFFNKSCRARGGRLRI